MRDIARAARNEEGGAGNARPPRPKELTVGGPQRLRGRLLPRRRLPAEHVVHALRPAAALHGLLRRRLRRRRPRRRPVLGPVAHGRPGRPARLALDLRRRGRRVVRRHPGLVRPACRLPRRRRRPAVALPDQARARLRGAPRRPRPRRRRRRALLPRRLPGTGRRPQGLGLRLHLLLRLRRRLLHQLLPPHHPAGHGCVCGPPPLSRPPCPAPSDHGNPLPSPFSPLQASASPRPSASSCRRGS